jgi:hypothetical protein
MNDRFVDHVTYSKHISNDKKVDNKNKYLYYLRVYNQYAKAVKVDNVDDKFKEIVDSYRQALEIPPYKRLNGAMKTSWIDYYNKHK